MDQRERDAAPEAASPEIPGRVTPMMEQYVEIRAANPDCLLFYRMGDFYELFFDDAVTASRALGITLTKRGKHLGDDIPMCGVPVHAADDYLQKLIALGHRVAVCEQTEDPAEARKRGGKSVVRRGVTRLVTPGTLTEERLLDAGRNNFLAAIVRIAGSDGADRHAMAWIDISTGEFRITECAEGGLAACASRVEPREVLVADRLAQDAEIRNAVGNIGAALTPLPAAFFDAGAAERRLCEAFGVATMEAFGAFSRAELSAGAALIAYIEKTQVAKRPPIEPPRRVGADEVMRLDAATRANLEIFRSAAGGRAGSLIAAIDRTKSAAGARLLAERLASPLCDPARIEERLESVDFFLARPQLRAEIRAALAAVPDMLRALSRIGLERGGPRDLDAIRAGLESSRAIAVQAGDREPGGFAADRGAGRWAGRGIGRAGRDAGLRAGRRAAAPEARRKLRAEGPRRAPRRGARPARREPAGHCRAAGRLCGRDRHPLAEDSPQQRSRLFRRGHRGAGAGARRRTASSTARRLPAPCASRPPSWPSWSRRSPAPPSGRFRSSSPSSTTSRGRYWPRKARSAPPRGRSPSSTSPRRWRSWRRPRISCGLASRTGLAFEIEGGRHPVVEQALRAAGQSFVGNDCDLGSPLPLRERVGSGLGRTSGEGEPPHPPLAQARGAPSPARGEGGAAAEAGRIWLVTGPNMAGKSTFLRQNALIAILAQAGSFVPARAARIGVVDAVFSRVGAADDLARGRSTFMVEMVETAAILNQAGARALVILDEIGRGTATFDGLSIAWAAIEHLHEENRCRALFATHYHELTALSAKLPRLSNATMKVKEWKGDVVFLHEVVPGAADRSYGIQVAKLAGLPPSVILRARQVLESLEKSDRSRPKDHDRRPAPLRREARRAGQGGARPGARRARRDRSRRAFAEGGAGADL